MRAITNSLTGQGGFMVINLKSVNGGVKLLLKLIRTVIEFNQKEDDLNLPIYFKY